MFALWLVQHSTNNIGWKTRTIESTYEIIIISFGTEQQLATAKLEPTKRSVGTITAFGDGIATISGLDDAMSGELIFARPTHLWTRTQPKKKQRWCRVTHR